MTMTLFAHAAVFGAQRCDGIVGIPGIMRAYREGSSSGSDLQGLCIEFTHTTYKLL